MYRPCQAADQSSAPRSAHAPPTVARTARKYRPAPRQPGTVPPPPKADDRSPQETTLWCRVPPQTRRTPGLRIGRAARERAALRGTGLTRSRWPTRDTGETPGSCAATGDRTAPSAAPATAEWTLLVANGPTPVRRHRSEGANGRPHLPDPA